MGGPRAANEQERRQRELESKRRWYYKNRMKKDSSRTLSTAPSAPSASTSALTLPATSTTNLSSVQASTSNLSGQDQSPVVLDRSNLPSGLSTGPCLATIRSRLRPSSSDVAMQPVPSTSSTTQPTLPPSLSTRNSDSAYVVPNSPVTEGSIDHEEEEQWVHCGADALKWYYLHKTSSDLLCTDSDDTDPDSNDMEGYEDETMTYAESTDPSSAADVKLKDEDEEALDDQLSPPSQSTEWRCASFHEKPQFIKSAKQYFDDATTLVDSPIEEVRAFLQRQTSQLSAARTAVQSVRLLFLRAAEQQRSCKKLFGPLTLNEENNRIIKFLQTAYFRARLLMQLHSKQIKFLSAAVSTGKIKEHMTGYMYWWKAVCHLYVKEMNKDGHQYVSRGASAAA